MKMMHKKLSEKAKQDPTFDPTKEMMCYNEVAEILSRRVTIPEPVPLDKEKEPVVKTSTPKGTVVYINILGSIFESPQEM